MNNITENRFTKIDNNAMGNPRYILHFLALNDNLCRNYVYSFFNHYLIDAFILYKNTDSQLIS